MKKDCVFQTATIIGLALTALLFFGKPSFAQNTTGGLTIVKEDVKRLAGNDPLQYINTARGTPSGVMAYIAAIHFPEKPGREQFLVIRHTGKAGKRVTADEVYHVISNNGYVLFDPQFSPDKRFLLFKFGWPYDTGGNYRLYLWDIVARNLELLPTENLFNRLVSWSPDSYYLAYAQGGDSEGVENNVDAPIRLFIYNRKTHQNRFVATSLMVTSLAWSSRDTLFYTVQAKTASLAADAFPLADPDIFAASAVGGIPQKVITQGVFPLPSPDGKWIVFFGEPDATPREVLTTSRDETTVSGTETGGGSKQGIYLVNRQTKMFHLLRLVSIPDFAARPNPLPIRFLWTADSKHLLILDRGDPQTSPSASLKTKDSRVKKIASVSSIDVAHFSARRVGVLEATDLESIRRSSIEPELQWIGFSADGCEAIVKVQEYGERVRDWYTRLTSLKSIRLSDGRLSNLAQTKDLAGSSLGLDWLSGVLPQQ